MSADEGVELEVVQLSRTYQLVLSRSSRGVHIPSVGLRMRRTGPDGTISYHGGFFIQLDGLGQVIGALERAMVVLAEEERQRLDGWQKE